MPGALRVERGIPLPLPTGASALNASNRVPAWAPVEAPIGSNRGLVLRREEGVWRSFVMSDALFDVVLIGQRRGGLIFGGEKEVLVTEQAFCGGCCVRSSGGLIARRP